MDAPAAPGGRIRRDPVDVLLFLVGVGGMAAAITLVFLGMRSVMDVGGYCAEGGAYVIRQSCPEGSTAALFLGIFGGFAATGLTAWKGSALGPAFGGAAILGWPALFGSLGFNFLQYGISPSPDAPGPDISWLICGVVFELMALPVVLGAIAGLRGALRAPQAGSGTVRPSAPLRPPPRRIAPDAPALRLALADLDRTLRAGLAARAAAETLAPDAAPVTSSGSAVAEVEDLVESLERLAALRDAGSITDEEFSAAKARLLEAADR